MANNNSGTTIMSGINQNEKLTGENIVKYALFAGGLDMTNAAAGIYDPLITGYGRLFMVRRPTFVQKAAGDAMTVFKHILEYGNTGVSGINDIEAEFDPMAGGYAGKSVDIMTSAKDNTSSFSVKVYEFSGSPIRALTHLWITGVSDLNSGLATYHGVDLGVNQANHTAEFIYVVTDRSGTKVEYACMFANCFPKQCKEDHFNYDAGTHNLVQLDVEFSCVKYESLAVNYYAKQLIDTYKLLSNHLNFNPGLAGEMTSGVVANDASASLAPNAELASNGPTGSTSYAPGTMEL